MSTADKQITDPNVTCKGLCVPFQFPGNLKFEEQRQCAAEIFHLHLRGSHCFLARRPQGPSYFPTRELLPLFSQSKINECHADITFPTYYGIDSLLSEEQQKQLIPWEERQNTLFFRGSTTGKAFDS